MIPNLPKPVSPRAKPGWLNVPLSVLVAVSIYTSRPFPAPAFADHPEQPQIVQQEAEEVAARTAEIHGSRTTLPQPFHEVTDLLEPLQRKDRKFGFHLQVQPQRGCDTIYHRNDNLIIDITAQKPLRYVYVDYYIATQDTVVHLFPNPRQPNNFVEEAYSLTLGQLSGPLHWQIDPPFGTELVTVIASSEPLFTRQRLFPEQITSYMAELQRVLLDQSSIEGLSATYCFITTADQ